MPTRELDLGLNSLDFARKMSLALIDAIPEEHWFHIPVENGNHAAWILGHIAWEDDDILKSLNPERGSKLPPAWHERFATGSRPTPEPDAYPSLDELRTAANALRAEVRAFFTGAADRLTDPVPPSVHGFAKDLAALMPLLACHEMIHVGQLTVIRKSLKLGPVFA